MNSSDPSLTQNLLKNYYVAMKLTYVWLPPNHSGTESTSHPLRSRGYWTSGDWQTNFPPIRRVSTRSTSTEGKTENGKPKEKDAKNVKFLGKIRKLAWVDLNDIDTGFNGITGKKKT